MSNPEQDRDPAPKTTQPLLEGSQDGELWHVVGAIEVEIFPRVPSSDDPANLRPNDEEE